MARSKRSHRRPRTFKEKVHAFKLSVVRDPDKFIDRGCAVFGVVFTLLMLSAGLGGLISSLSLARHGISTTGTITSSQHSRFSTTYNVLFGISNGDEIDLDTTTSFWPTYSVGETVPVLYNPSNPQEAEVATFFNMWALPAALLTMGGIIGFFSLEAIVRLL